jgi:hypothetical protein
MKTFRTSLIVQLKAEGCCNCYVDLARFGCRLTVRLEARFMWESIL